jgi:hypothetical protein
MQFEPVDFNVYNKPPYLPQYLSRGETKKLVSFDDAQFAELDRLIDKASDQYDLDKAKGILLDRLGKLADENRDGNDDELYRLLIRLRILLNTTDGSINDIIKVIKFIFSSEVVHIQQNYPAGLTILHDGESPTINFNKYIAQVVAAGVAYDTKELFFFTEKINVTESPKITAKRMAKEEFFGQIKHNGRIARDGHTVRNVEAHGFKHNGKVKRDGTAQRKGVYWEPAYSVITPPFRHSSGAQDLLVLIIKPGLTDEYHGRVKRNGFFKRNATIKHDGVNPLAASDIIALSGQMDMVDILPPVEDTQNIQVGADMADDMNKYIRHNGAIKRNGKHVHCNFPVTQHRMHGSIVPVAEEYGAVNEVLSAGMRYHHFHNGTYRRNGTIQHNGNMLIPLE